MVKRFDDATYKRRIEPLIERWFMPRTKAELEALAGDRIALTPIKKIDEVVGDPHLRAREMFVPVRVGDSEIEVFGSPLKLSRSPVRTRGVAPTPGQHNREVYVEWLGLSTERFESLRAGGVV
jgi:crotonobetainyl-CoA:carnitine CoA-transferase CaiB-like acyl-CoA transferase